MEVIKVPLSNGCIRQEVSRIPLDSRTWLVQAITKKASVPMWIGLSSTAVLVTIVTSARVVWRLMRTRPCFPASMLQVTLQEVCTTTTAWEETLSLGSVCSLCRDPLGANPVNKVIQFLADLESKINAEGLEAHRVHEEFTLWIRCGNG